MGVPLVRENLNCYHLCFVEAGSSVEFESNTARKMRSSWRRMEEERVGINKVSTDFLHDRRTLKKSRLFLHISKSLFMLQSSLKNMFDILLNLFCFEVSCRPWKKIWFELSAQSSMEKRTESCREILCQSCLEKMFGIGHRLSCIKALWTIWMNCCLEVSALKSCGAYE